MSLKQLLGLDDMNLSDVDIMGKIKDAYDNDLDEVEFWKDDGTKVVVRLPHIDSDDPWEDRVREATGAA